MTVFSCTTDRYDQLYARWLAKPGELLDLGGYKPSECLLDLCGGSGAVSKEAARRGGQRICLFDLNPRLRHEHVCNAKGDASHLCDSIGPGGYDLVVCRQAVGYLDVATVFPQVARVLEPHGRFVFNTFVKPRWAFKRYEFEGRRFTEASAYAFGRVMHLQAAAGIGTDVTLFRWHRDDELLAALQPDFNVTVDRKPRSTHWLCKRLP